MNIHDFTVHLKNEEVPWRLFVPAESHKDYAVLWLQGWTSSMDSHRDGVERMAKQSGTAFATLDYAGHGLHETPLEDATHEQQHEEVVAVFDQLKEREYENIIVIGGSFGGYMTALLLARRPVHAAILRAPAIYADNEFTLPFKDTPRYKSAGRHYEPAALEETLRTSAASQAIKDYPGFVYVLEHELDSVVPPAIPKHYFGLARKGNYLIIPNTEHSPKLMQDPPAHYAYIEHILIALLRAIQLGGTLSTT